MVNIPVVTTSFFPNHRKEYDFMELWVVREQFQSNMIGKDNSRSVEIGKAQSLCCSIIFVIYGVKI